MPKDSDPSVEIKAAEPKWLLIKNPRFGDVASEPSTSGSRRQDSHDHGTLVFGKTSLIASPEIVASTARRPEVAASARVRRWRCR
jgi:hypothetical protein